MSRIVLMALAVVAFVAACAGPPAAGGATLGEEELRRGVITQIDAVSLEHHHQVGLGAVLGAAAGGLVGSNIGRGTGRDVAMVLGAIGGGVLGDRAERSNYERPQQGRHVVVRLDSGVSIAVTQPADRSLRVGDAVLIQGRGQQARVVRR